MSGRSKHVLVVEDNAGSRRLATLLLEAEGYAVTAVAGGADALARAGGDFEFVLLDLQLPGIDGFEVARRIRAIRPGAELPIIAVSAFVMPSERSRAFAAGCTGFLEKPIDADVFVAQLRCVAGVVTTT